MAIKIPLPRGYLKMFSGLMRAETLAEEAGEPPVLEACAGARRELLRLHAEKLLPEHPGLFGEDGIGEVLIPVEIE